MTAVSKATIVGVIGAGTMGAGIAQVAAAAGHEVLLFDASQGAAATGIARLAKGLDGLVAKDRMSRADADGLIGRIKVAGVLSDLAPAGLVIEAIVEKLEVKQSVFRELEAVLSPDAVIATNTSSISVTSIGAALERPGQLVGMHFFNPAPVMKLVEVVSGIATEPAVAQMIHETATLWGKVAVHTKSTPGFIVNRVARAFYGEPMRLLEEGVATVETLDGLLRHGGGFRMGPFELMDLIGNDVNFAVSRSVFDAMFQEPRFRPSLLQQELVGSGRLGRKSGRGWYDYSKLGAPVTDAAASADTEGAVWGALSLDRDEERAGIVIALTDGQTAAQRQAQVGSPVIVHDLVTASRKGGWVGFAASSRISAAEKQSFVATLAAQGLVAVELPDWPGLVVLRTLALIANEGFEAVLQGIADEAGIDAAMIYGVNYPKGPIAWAREVGLDRICSLLSHVGAATGDMRYRPSLRLRMSVHA
jgi:3-hydroxybutyryl-CoA dehydrogenase